jgi:hypothetical protein
MKTILLTTLLTSSVFTCLSQTITAPTIPANGVTFTVSKVSTVAVSNVPINGGWNFSSVATTPDNDFSLLPKSSSQYAADFPSSTHVRMIGTNTEAFIAYSGNDYKFCGSPFMPYPNPLNMHVWPLSVGTNHTDSVYMTFPGPGGITITRKDKIVVNALSTGTLTMPNGVVHNNALLVKVMRTFSDVPPDGSGPYVTSLDMHHWWVQGWPVPLVETRKQMNPMNPTVYESSTFKTPTTLNASELEAIEVAVYPNPTNDIFYVKAPINSSLNVTDVSGKHIKSIVVETEETAVNLSDATNGIYFVQVQTADRVLTKKVIKN